MQTMIRLKRTVRIDAKQNVANSADGSVPLRKIAGRRHLFSKYATQ